MRWLFLFVLFLNLAYVGWQVSQSSADSYAGIQSLQDVKPIVLLSEMRSQAVEDKMEAVAKKPELDKSERLATNASEKKQQPNIEKVAKTETSKPKQLEISETVVEGKKTPSTIQVLSESPLDRCFEIGPFRVLDTLSRLTQEIKPYVITTSFRSSEKNESTVYWVYIKPEQSRKKAVEVGKRLKAKKIKDFYVIRDGEKVNGLSLGHFRNKGGAYSLMKKVKNMGFNVQVEPVYKNYSLYWLDYQLAVDKKIPATVFEKYMKSVQKEKITRLSRDCSG